MSCIYVTCQISKAKDNAPRSSRTSEGVLAESWEMKEALDKVTFAGKCGALWQIRLTEGVLIHHCKEALQEMIDCTQTV